MRAKAGHDAALEGSPMNDSGSALASTQIEDVFAALTVACSRAAVGDWESALRHLAEAERLGARKFESIRRLIASARRRPKAKRRG